MGSTGIDKIFGSKFVRKKKYSGSLLSISHLLMLALKKIIAMMPLVLLLSCLKLKFEGVNSEKNIVDFYFTVVRLSLHHKGDRSGAKGLGPL